MSGAAKRVPPTCPWCGSANLDQDEVDNGVGMQKCGPRACADCHAIEFGPYDPEGDTGVMGPTPDEMEVGWWRGSYSPEHPRPAPPPAAPDAPGRGRL